MRIQLKCGYCSRGFWIYASNVKWGSGKYCSKKCQHDSQKERLHKIHACKVCGKKFDVYISSIKDGAGKYCSQKCKNIFRERRIEGNCLICGKKFVFRPSESRKYCSRKCYNKVDHHRENNAFWKGGTSFEPYAINWNETFKRSIRERDGYICQVCGKQQSGQSLCVHHIDYCKQNCDPKNLVSLCVECHRRTLGRREYWKNLFKKEKKNVK